MHVKVCIWKSKESLPESVFSYHVGPQVVSLGRKHFNPWSHLTSPVMVFLREREAINEKELAEPKALVSVLPWGLTSFAGDPGFVVSS